MKPSNTCGGCVHCHHNTALAEDCPEKLSDWENEFIAALAGHKDDYQLSEKQNAVLNRISQKLED